MLSVKVLDLQFFSFVEKKWGRRISNLSGLKRRITHHTRFSHKTFTIIFLSLSWAPDGWQRKIFRKSWAIVLIFFFLIFNPQREWRTSTEVMRLSQKMMLEQKCNASYKVDYCLNVRCKLVYISSSLVFFFLNPLTFFVCFLLHVLWLSATTWIKLILWKKK